MSQPHGTMDGLQRAVVLGAALNIVGLPIVSKWSSRLLMQVYPEHSLLVSTEGVVNLQLWGVAYLAAAHSLSPGRHPQPWIFVVLAMQKVVCAGAWARWLLYDQNPVNLEQVWNDDPLAELGFCAPPPPRKRRTTPTGDERVLRMMLYLGAFGSSCFLPWWVYWASGSSGTTLRVQYPEVLSHEGIATITLWGLLSVVAAQSLGGAQPQPWLFATLCFNHLFYFACCIKWLFAITGLASFLALLIARPLVVLFFGGAGLHCLCYAAVTTVCAMACFRRDNLLQMKRNRGHLRETSDETPATALTGEQLQRDLRRRVNLGPRTND